MQEHSSPHVCQRDAGHDDESADHEALSPCFEDETIWVRRFRDVSFCDRKTLLHHKQNRAHLGNRCHEPDCGGTVQVAREPQQLQTLVVISALQKHEVCE